ncbi:hypothetical protein ACN2C7_03295 [Caulobacter sp. ErkDOM-E]|uniref:hypothetical protein n=1 Tax=Caulobacter sp. ErkDOM-E TaxID=3402778 RepID=UPI003AF60AA3
MTVDQARASLLLIMEELAEDFRRKHPAWKASIVDSAVGGSTAYQAHAFGLSCLAYDEETQTDLLDLTVVIAHLDDAPSIESADLVWGDGRIVAELISEPIAFSVEQLTWISGELPILVRAMEQALSVASRSKPMSA